MVIFISLILAQSLATNVLALDLRGRCQVQLSNSTWTMLQCNAFHDKCTLRLSWCLQIPSIFSAQMPKMYWNSIHIPHIWNLFPSLHVSMIFYSHFLGTSWSREHHILLQDLEEEIPYRRDAPNTTRLHKIGIAANPFMCHWSQHMSIPTKSRNLFLVVWQALQLADYQALAHFANKVRHLPNRCIFPHLVIVALKNHNCKKRNCTNSCTQTIPNLIRLFSGAVCLAACSNCGCPAAAPV